MHALKDRRISVKHIPLLFKGCRNLNPIPYHAEYMGHKLHMDQNEKMCMFGATHVATIVAIATMPIKNNVIIYDEVYRWVLYYAKQK